MGSLRARIHRQLDPEAWDGPGFSPFNWTVIFAVFALIFLSILATEPEIAKQYGRTVLHAEQVIIAAFAVEYGLRIWTIGLNPKFAGASGRLRYMLTPSSLADLVVILPLFLALPPGWTPALRVLRLLRLVRLAALPRVRDALAEFGAALAEKRYEFLLTSIIGLVLLLTSSTILFLVEGDAQPEAFGSVPRAIWWSVITFTTVGYGDAVPVTWLGRFFAGIFAVFGIALLAMFTGIVASALSDASQIHAERRGGDCEPPGEEEE